MAATRPSSCEVRAMAIEAQAGSPGEARRRAISSHLGGKFEELTEQVIADLEAFFGE